MADMKPQGTQAYSVPDGYESADANIRSIIVGTIIVASSVFVVMAAMFAMFNVLNERINDEQSRTPVTLTEKIVPPEPRLLPSPYTDEALEARAIEAKIAKAEGRPVKPVTADPLPWDKRTLEIEQQYDESNAIARTAEGKIQIPIERAMELEAGVEKGGTPAVMAWQPEFPGFMAGKTNGQMNLQAGQKEATPETFDQRPKWETQDEKFTSDSTGGTVLKRGAVSR